MNKMLFIGILFAALLLVNVPVQGQVGGQFSQEQQITILPPSTAAQINCCVLPFNKIFVGRQTRVLWNNQSGTDVRVTIGKGTKCKEIPGNSQVPYEIGSMGCYVIQSLPQDNSRPVKLIDGGKYDYTIEYLGTDKVPGTGSITVFNQ
ncbi:MAG: hypothetical protein ACYDHW_07300 [Syntrophorhabdaceae bacterium]